MVKKYNDGLYCNVVYDIEDDKIRLKISETCLDYGLERIQYSAFSGYLSRNKTEELFYKLRDLLGDEKGRILALNLCKKDEEKILMYDNLK
jgi:CRISPR-associated protein Cas2